MSKTIVHWTSQEIATAKKVMRKAANVKQAAVDVAKTLNRPKSGTLAKLYQLSKKKRKQVKTTNPVPMTSRKTNGASEFTFEVVPNKIVVKKGYVQIYF